MASVGYLLLLSLTATAYETQKGNIFTSLTSIQQLARLDRNVVDMLSFYKNQINELSKSVETYVADQDESHTSSMISENPLMAFNLIRKFVKDLADINRNLKDLTILKMDLDDLLASSSIPSIEDMTGAAYGVRQLQHTYQLPTVELVKGIIMKKETSARLTAFDMEFIGQKYMDDKRYAHALEWLYYSWQQILHGDWSTSKDSVLQKLTEIRVQHNTEFLKFHPTKTGSLFSGLVSSTFENIPELVIEQPEISHRLKITEPSYHDMNNFNALCRGEELLDKKDKISLRCWYSRELSLYNVINPLKVELHHENPVVYQIHDILNENTINHVNNLSMPWLSRAGVVSEEGFVSSFVRTSTSVFLPDHEPEDKVLNQFPGLVHRLTGLETISFKAAEQLQISCYGPTGGYYYPHFDALQDPNDPSGDRVTTVMFYLSDVHLGGATAFPRLGIAVKPEKGSAVVWHNLLKNGNLDKLTLHGGCPVLLGTKWVANKWIRANEQFQLIKCSINMED